MKLLRRCLVGLGVFLALLLALGIAALCALHWYQPKVPLTAFPAPKPVSGAAVFYNQAFAAMPELSENQKKLLAIPPDKPLDFDKAVKLIEQFEPSLKLLEQGAKEPECEWGLDLNLGEALGIPQIVKGFQLTKVLCLRARWRLESGNASAAADDVLLSLRVSRHLGAPGLVITKLIQISTDMTAINFAARHLAEFDAAAWQKLSDGIAGLPPSHSMQEVMVMESKCITTYLRDLQAKENERGTFLNGVQMCLSSLSMGNQAGSTDAPVIKMMRASPALYLFMVSKYEQRMQEFEKLMYLPYVEGRPKIEAFEKELKTARLDIISRFALPALSGLRRKEVQMETAWAIFRTALDAQIHDPGSVRAELAKLRDPYDDSPLDWRDVKGGVEVKLKAPPNQKTLTLMVGLSGK